MWEFWKDKCYRTVKGMYPDVKMERSGTHHNALDDAFYQTLHLIAINEVSNGRVL
jgi:exodeoxyribonuclease VIII